MRIGLYLRMLNYFRMLKRLYLPFFIADLIVTIPIAVLGFTVLPQYIRYTEPKPYTDSILMGLIWALLWGLFSPILVKDIEEEKKRRDEKRG